MNLDTLIRDLKRLSVETGSLACLGCRHENSCGVRGCALICEAVEQLGKMHRYLRAFGDCDTCKHSKETGYDDEPCTCCMRGERWEWMG